MKKKNISEYRNEQMFADKLSSDGEINEDVLLESFRRNERHSLKTLISLYRGQYFSLFLSVVFFAIKHSPVWVLPIVTANIINIATRHDPDALREISINVIVMAVLIAQNILTNYLHTYFYAKVIRNVECGLRSSM